MNNTFRLRILAADKVFYEGNCTSLTIYRVPPRCAGMLATVLSGP